MTTQRRTPRPKRITNDGRGNTRDRKRRKQFLLDTFGDGTTTHCWECGSEVTITTVIADRITPAEQGGRYTRNNIRPHCPTCSHRQGGKRSTEKRYATTHSSDLADNRTTSPR